MLRNNFCSSCLEALCICRLESASATSPDLLHHNTWVSFQTAVKEECMICSVVWKNVDQSLHLPLADTKFTGKSTFWNWYSYDSISCFGKFKISCRDPIDPFVTVFEEKFQILPYDEIELQATHEEPVGEHQLAEVKALKFPFQWYLACTRSHPGCHIPLLRPKGKWTPTRLLYIGPRGETEWKLCHPAKIPGFDSAYMTLSYRWSLSKNFTLEESNLDKFCRGLPVDCLPRTFQDAVLVAHHFQIQYLWIDALCIIQDSYPDWEYEALNMCDIYSRSACNIAATAMVDEHSGLFHRREIKARLPVTIAELQNFSKQKFIILNKNYWDRQLLTGSLHSRGWVFQECLLAPRVIYFAESQILWECFAESRCEEFPNGIPFHFSRKNFDPLCTEFNRNDKNFFAGEVYQMPVSVAALWDELVGRYSGCDLTKASDKLIAFSGIAKLFTECTKDHYLAGLWKSRLLEQLNWFIDEPRLRPQVHRAPSWSWAAVDGTVSQFGMFNGATSLVTIVNVKADYHAARTMNGGFLELRGVLTVFHKRSGVLFRPDCLEAESNPDDPISYYLPLQVNTRSWDFSGSGECIFYVVGVVLKPLGHESPNNMFQRLGFFSTEDSHDLQDLGYYVSSSGLVEQKDTAQVCKIIIF